MTINNTQGQAEASNSEWAHGVGKQLEAAGCLVYVLTGNSFSAGLPDRLIVHRDFHGCLELKGFGDAPRGNQKIVADRMCRRGFPSLLARRRRPGEGKGWLTLTCPVLKGQEWDCANGGQLLEAMERIKMRLDEFIDATTPFGAADSMSINSEKQ